MTLCMMDPLCSVGDEGGSPAIISDFGALLPGGVFRACQYDSVLLLRLAYHMVAELLVEVDVSLRA